MRKILPVLFAVALALGAQAQGFHIEKSVAFEEPDFGWNKLLQLKNGNTFFFHSTKKDGIELVVYDKTRKIIGKRTLVSKLWDESKMKKSQIKGVYEINGEPVIFVVQADGREPYLYRMRLNPNTGFIVKEDEVASMPKIGAFAGYSIVMGGVDIPDIFVEKDPASDCYAVILYNSLAHETNERVKVLHFDGAHKKISEAFFESPGDKFKYVNYISAVVDGNKRVFVATYDYNGARNKDDLSRVVVSKLNAGEKKFSHKLLDFTEDFDDTKAIMLYNHGSNEVQLLSVSFLNTTNKWFSSSATDHYLTILTSIDPESLNPKRVKPLVGAMIDAYGKQNIGADYQYSGMPQQMIINKDNTVTVLFEAVKTEVTQSGHLTRTRVFLGPIGVSELSDTCKEIRGYAISKKQIVNHEVPDFFIQRRSKGIFAYPPGITTSFSGISQFMSYDYINAEKGRYVLFNDLPKNMEREEENEKRKAVTYISETNAVCYKLNDGKVEKFYLFGEPADKRAAGTFCYIDAADFNKEANTYATIIIQREGTDKEARIAWITFD